MEFTFPNEAKCAIPIGVKNDGRGGESCDGDKVVRTWCLYVTGESPAWGQIFFFKLGNFNKARANMEQV